MSWENDTYNIYIPKRPRDWKENVAALSQVTPSGRLSSKTVELNPNVESRIVNFLTPRRMTHKTRTPANIMKYEKFERNLKKAANTMKRKLNFKEFQRLYAELEARNKPIRNAEEALIKQQVEARRQLAQQQEEYKQYIENATLRSTPEYHAALRNEQNRLARISSRKKRGISFPHKAYRK